MKRLLFVIDVRVAIIAQDELISFGSLVITS